jgi:hypothetical protein
VRSERDEHHEYVDISQQHRLSSQDFPIIAMLDHGIFHEAALMKLLALRQHGAASKT